MDTCLIIIAILSVAFFFLKKSKSTVFERSTEELDTLESDLIKLLSLKKRTTQDIQLYKDAFLFFRHYTTKFDGATIAKDLEDLPKLDADAVVHDYECLIGANRNYIKWFKAAWRYFENMRKNGKGNQIFRLLLLFIVGIFFVPYCYLITPKYYPIKSNKL